MIVEEYVLAKMVNLPDDKPNRVYYFNITGDDSEAWLARKEIAELYGENVQEKYPDYDVGITHYEDGPQSYLIKVNIR